MSESPLSAPTAVPSEPTTEPSTMYDATNKTLVTTADIVAGLHALGIQEGDLLQVHSSLSALGYVQGGAEAVVDALLQAVGASGTVMVPTFNHGTVAVFDPATSPSVSGAIFRLCIFFIS